MSQNLRSQADWLATEGNLAAAPNLYWWSSMLRWLRTIMRKLGPGRDAPSTTSKPYGPGWPSRGGCTGRIGVVGLDASELRHPVMRLIDDRQMVNGPGGGSPPKALRPYPAFTGRSESAASSIATDMEVPARTSNFSAQH
jgi:hypothetical protein